jgi:adenosine deaminase
LKSNKLIKQKPFQVIFKKIFYDFDDKLIKQYREKLRKENNLKDFMDSLYEIFNFIEKNFKNL